MKKENEVSEEQSENVIEDETGDEPMGDTLTYDELMRRLAPIVETPYWKLIVSFNRMAITNFSSQFYTIDPYKEPTSIARTQGCLQGLPYMEQQIVTWHQKLKDLEEGKKPESDEPNVSYHNF